MDIETMTVGEMNARISEVQVALCEIENVVKFMHRVKAGDIVALEMGEMPFSYPLFGMTKLRLFVSTAGELCYFAKGKSRRGYRLEFYLFDYLKRIVGKPEPKDAAKEKYNEIAKYRKLACASTLDNDFVRSAKELPATFGEWVADGSKSLYQYHVTTGTRIDGKVISLESFAKQYPHLANEYSKALANKVDYSGSRVPFRGYDSHLAVWSDGKGGWLGGLSMEYKGCGNGYYYLAITADKFIGYDID